LQAVSQSRRHFGRFLLLQNLHFRHPWRSRHASACRKLATRSAEQPVGPEGRALKRTVAALHFLPRATAIAGEARLAPERFRSRRGHMQLIRGALT
ncbi:MAG: hypothetical protein QGG67_16195, partial [Gammaproteobacteria bacterium]|nr:hypothetical protein [Gammaproteobacteria bacterium]